MIKEYRVGRWERGRGGMVRGLGKKNRSGKVRVVRSKQADGNGQLASRVQGDV